MYGAVGRVELENRFVDPDIQNSNTLKFRGPLLRAPAADQRRPDDDVLEAVREYFQRFGSAPTAESWAAGFSPSEKTVRRRFGSFRAAIEAVASSRPDLL